MRDDWSVVGVHLCISPVRGDGGAGPDATGAGQCRTHPTSTICKVFGWSCECTCDESLITMILACTPFKQATTMGVNFHFAGSRFHDIPSTTHHNHYICSSLLATGLLHRNVYGWTTSLHCECTSICTLENFSTDSCSHYVLQISPGSVWFVVLAGAWLISIACFLTGAGLVCYWYRNRWTKHPLCVQLAKLGQPLR